MLPNVILSIYAPLNALLNVLGLNVVFEKSKWELASEALKLVKVWLKLVGDDENVADAKSGTFVNLAEEKVWDNEVVPERSILVIFE
mgnify:CR=1 FL=1